MSDIANLHIGLIVKCCMHCRKKERILSFTATNERTGRHLPYGITQCYLLPDTSERTPP